MKKTMVIMFCLLGMLLFSGCDESKVNPEDIPTIEEIIEPIEEIEPVEEVNETIEEVNETVNVVNLTAVEEEEIIYTDEELNLCKESSLENFNLTGEEMSVYNYLTGLVKLEQTTKKALINNLDISTYTGTTLEAFTEYLTCIHYSEIE